MGAEPVRVPFSVADQAVWAREAAGDPWNAVLEIVTGVVIDEGRLREAAHAALRRHPMARAHCADDLERTAVPHWTITDDVEGDPLRVRDCPDDDALDGLRQEIVLERIPLDRSPLARVVLARRPGGDVVFIQNSHVMMDGLSIVRFAQSVATAYRGDVDPPDPVDPIAARSGSPAPAAGTPAAAPATRAAKARGLAAKALWGLRLLTSSARPPARIAPVPAATGPRYGFTQRRLDPERTSALLAARPPGTTLNDVILGALHLAIDRWDAAHGAPAGKITVNVPVSTRPVEWGAEVVGNFIASEPISTTPEQRRDLPTACEAAAAQVAAWRQRVVSGQVPSSVPVGAHGRLPLPLKRFLPALLARATGGRVQPTIDLSNIGRFPEALRFGDAAPGAVWGSGPCPVGAGLVVLTTGGALCLTLRHRRDVLSADAGRGFMDELVAALPG